MKTEIRHQVIEIRNQSSPKLFTKQNDEMIQMIENDQAYQESKYIGIFYPLRNEVNLLPLTKGNKKYAFPRVEKDGIHFYMLEQTTSFKKSKFGVLEPMNGTNVDGLIDYLLVPALAISKSGYRIGFGKGYYDKFLSQHRPQYVKGVIFDFQEIDFNQEEHDQKLDSYFKGSK